MELQQVWTVVKTFLKSLVDAWYVFFSLLGVVVFASSHWIVDPLWQNILFSSGSLIVVSGGFSALTRWLSVHGIVKKELQNILFSNDYLKDADRFDTVWNKLVTLSISQYMPSLDTHLQKDFLREYLPSKHELFYRKYHQSLDIYWHDKANKIIKVIERSDITIYTTNAEPHILPYRLTAEFPTRMNLEYTIETLKIDGIDRAFEAVEQSQTTKHITTKEISYQLQLTGKKEYRYFRKMTRFISLEHEPFIVLSSSWHTYRPRVTINCHDREIKAYFTSTGTMQNFATIDGKNNSEYMEEQYPALMMKAQGYFIYFAAK